MWLSKVFQYRTFILGGTLMTVMHTAHYKQDHNSGNNNIPSRITKMNVYV